MGGNSHVRFVRRPGETGPSRDGRRAPGRPDLGQAAVEDVRRRRRQQETLGRRGHRDDPLYRGQRLLRLRFTTLSKRQWTRLELTLTVGDPSEQLTSAWMVPQELQLLYAGARDQTDARHGSTRSSTGAPAPRCPS